MVKELITLRMKLAKRFCFLLFSEGYRLFVNVQSTYHSELDRETCTTDCDRVTSCSLNIEFSINFMYDT